MSKDLQVFVTAGQEDPEKVTLALATALAAASSGQEVVVFFTIRGALWTGPALPEHDPVPGFPGIAELIEMLVEMEVEMEGCTSCVDTHLDTPKDESGHRTMAAGFRHGGLSGAALRMSSVPTTVF